jgi:hypothetical protein
MPASWSYTFAWLPHRCSTSGKLIWFKRAYLGIKMYTGPGTPVYEYTWLEKKYFLIEKIKGTLE